MRWTDVPPQATPRTVDAWCAAQHEAVGADVLAAIGQRIAASNARDRPIVIVAPDAWQAAWDHVVDSSLERGGLLLGEPLAVASVGSADDATDKSADDATALAVYVRTAVPGRDDDATEYSLRLGTGVWDAARAALKPGEIVVGWFHSHPDIGAFFSGTDRRTQAGFFPHPFSVGWVIDPVRREQAWFVGPQSRQAPGGSVVLMSAGPPGDG